VEVKTPKKTSTGITLHASPPPTSILRWWKRTEQIVHTKQSLNTPKPPPIYIQDVITIPPLLQLLEQVAPQAYETKAFAQNQVKVQLKTSGSYPAIFKALADKHTECHTYKPKEEGNNRVALKHMHYSVDPADIKEETENLGHKVVNIWNIKQYRTKLPLSMFFVDLKPASTNKETFQVEYLQQCRIKFEPQHKRDIAQCANCQRYGHTKKYRHLKPQCVKCAGDHLTHQCPRKDRSSFFFERPNLFAICNNTFSKWWEG
jgi:hypothetical protein